METVSIINYGKASLTISQNGIALANGTNFQIESIVSSTQDYVSLASGSKVLAANGIENWAVTLNFDPSDTGLLTDTLVITSDDPDEATVNVSLGGTGIPTPNQRWNAGSGLGTRSGFAGARAPGLGRSRIARILATGPAPSTRASLRGDPVRLPVPARRD